MNPRMIEFLEWAKYQYRSWNGKFYRLKKRLGIVTNDSNKPSEYETINTAVNLTLNYIGQAASDVIKEHVIVFLI